MSLDQLCVTSRKVVDIAIKHDNMVIVQFEVQSSLNRDATIRKLAYVLEVDTSFKRSINKLLRYNLVLITPFSIFVRNCTLTDPSTHKIPIIPCPTIQKLHYQETSKLKMSSKFFFSTMAVPFLLFISCGEG